MRRVGDAAETGRGRRPRSRLDLSWLGGGRGHTWMTPIQIDRSAPPRGGRARRGNERSEFAQNLKEL
jgi:hypothetical protein